ncbi:MULTISPECIES: hypothetical protein [unclassified Thioalkalivibrio]|uniref:hypothetical protein n=1 Tax=unclassified Thioalkalivibrio TaxID=2621013 RepID=UPI00035D9D3E|nr:MULTISPECIES: hypothetical protein [unclassified Thioalkalivibrio]
MDVLPYRYVTPSGEAVSFEFRLHPETGSAVRVQQLLDRLTDTLDNEIGLLGDTCNGDVLQALAMALAVRTEMIPADPDMTQGLARDVVERALKSLAEAQHRQTGPVGHA